MEAAGGEAVRVRSGDRRRNHLQEGVLSERELVRVLLHRRELTEQVAERIHYDLFKDVVYRKIFTELVSLGPDASLGEVEATFTEEAIDELNALLEEGGGLDFPQETIEGCIAKMELRDDAMRLAELDRLIPLASDEQKSDMIDEKRLLHRRMGGLPQKRWKQFPFPSS